MKIHLARPTLNDLQDVEHYIIQNNPAAAVRTVSRILEAIDYLAKHPTMGRPGRVPDTRELIISGTPFIVVYQIRQHVIFIVRVLHAARKWP